MIQWYQQGLPGGIVRGGGAELPHIDPGELHDAPVPTEVEPNRVKVDRPGHRGEKRGRWRIDRAEVAKRRAEGDQRVSTEEIDVARESRQRGSGSRSGRSEDRGGRTFGQRAGHLGQPSGIAR